MARAAPVELDPAEPFAAAAARVVRIRTQEVFAHAGGVLDTSDIERVHDMRVSTRRLRAVLEIFRPAFPKREFKDVLRDVKALADALGERRDPDVQLEALEKLAGELLASQRPGVKALADRQRERQAAGNEALATALRETEASRLRERLLALADEAGRAGIE